MGRPRMGARKMWGWEMHPDSSTKKGGTKTWVTFFGDGTDDDFLMIKQPRWLGRLQKRFVGWNLRTCQGWGGAPQCSLEQPEFWEMHLQDRGFGFVTVDADETDLYFHIKDMLQEDQQKVSNGLKLPGQRVPRLHRRVEYSNLCFMGGHSIKPRRTNNLASQSFRVGPNCLIAREVGGVYFNFILWHDKYKKSSPNLVFSMFCYCKRMGWSVALFQVPGVRSSGLVLGWDVGQQHERQMALPRCWYYKLRWRLKVLQVGWSLMVIRSLHDFTLSLPMGFCLHLDP